MEQCEPLASGVASTIAGLVQLTMHQLMARTEEGGWPFPAASAAMDRWRAVDLVLALTPLVLLVQPIVAGRIIENKMTPPHRLLRRWLSSMTVSSTPPLSQTQARPT